MKIGDKLKFKKFNWTIVDKFQNQYGNIEYHYRVHRKYLNLMDKYLIPLSNTECIYPIQQWRWNFLKEQLQKNPNYHYNQHLWSNQSR